MPTRQQVNNPEKNSYYVARSHVRKFLTNYARPSVLDDLLDSDLPPDWEHLVREIRNNLSKE
jgi:hypothetical protein